MELFGHKLDLCIGLHWTFVGMECLYTKLFGSGDWISGIRTTIADGKASRKRHPFNKNFTSVLVLSSLMDHGKQFV